MRMTALRSARPTASLKRTSFRSKGVLDAIRKGPALRQRYLTPKNALKKTWNNVFRLRRKRKVKTIDTVPFKTKALRVSAWREPR